MKRAYEATIKIRFAVEGEDADAVDSAALSFASNVAAWVGGTGGSPPFAPWMTAWLKEPLEVLPLREAQLASWPTLAAADPLAPFAEDEPPS